MYEQLLKAVQASSISQGHPTLLRPLPAWADNPTAGNFVVVHWQNRPGAFDLVVVNLAPHPSQCYLQVPAEDGSPERWRVRDLLGSQRFERDTPGLLAPGLYLDVPGHGAQILHFQAF